MEDRRKCLCYPFYFEYFYGHYTKFICMVPLVTGKVGVSVNFKEPSSLEVVLSKLEGYMYSRNYDRYVGSFGLKGSEWVLDYGSGSGRIAQHIAGRLTPTEGHLTCVDISAVWMDVVRKRLKQYSNVDFKRGEISALDIPNDAYDVVVLHFVLHHIEQEARQKNVGILAHKLKKGGRLFIREPIREGHGTPEREIKKLLSDAGMSECEFHMEKSAFMGAIYSGVFIKDSYHD